jgi:hypothetical protein
MQAKYRHDYLVGESQGCEGNYNTPLSTGKEPEDGQGYICCNSKRGRDAEQRQVLYLKRRDERGRGAADKPQCYKHCKYEYNAAYYASE